VVGSKRLRKLSKLNEGNDDIVQEESKGDEEETIKAAGIPQKRRKISDDE